MLLWVLYETKHIVCLSIDENQVCDPTQKPSSCLLPYQTKKFCGPILHQVSLCSHAKTKASRGFKNIILRGISWIVVPPLFRSRVPLRGLDIGSCNLRDPGNCYHTKKTTKPTRSISITTTDQVQRPKHQQTDQSIHTPTHNTTIWTDSIAYHNSHPINVTTNKQPAINNGTKTATNPPTTKNTQTQQANHPTTKPNA